MSPVLQYEVTAVNKATGIQYEVCIFISMPFPQQYLLEPSPHFTTNTSSTSLRHRDLWGGLLFWKELAHLPGESTVVPLLWVSSWAPRFPGHGSETVQVNLLLCLSVPSHGPAVSARGCSGGQANVLQNSLPSISCFWSTVSNPATGANRACRNHGGY